MLIHRIGIVMGINQQKTKSNLLSFKVNKHNLFYVSIIIIPSLSLISRNIYDLFKNT